MGAAGGPKWLVLYGMDRVLYKKIIKQRTKPLFLIGSSIAIWRFTALSQNNGLKGIDTFLQRYMNQKYSLNPTRDEISNETDAILEDYFPNSKIDEILTHPVNRMVIITARSKHCVVSEKKFPLSIGLGAAALSNAMHRKCTQFFFDRFVFYDGRNFPDFIQWNDFHTNYFALNRENLKSAIKASGAIPLVMRGITFNHNGHTYMLRDGGLVDYQMDIPLQLDDSIALYPHYTDKIIPGWFDKTLFWRKPANSFDNVVMISPSQEAIENMPLKKIPDRKDFYTFAGKDTERLAYWAKAIEVGQKMADEFAELVESGKIKDRVVLF